MAVVIVVMVVMIMMTTIDENRDTDAMISHSISSHVRHMYL